MENHEMQDLRRDILAWHDRNARDLPWRGETDPYRIWVSEIMLQQTRAETAIAYYARFLADFPSVGALAAADAQSVLKDWEGLGYYSRARNLQAAARQIVEQLSGRFPRDVEGLRALPGIGEYTAGAIASMAYGLPEPAIDGNQIRVLSRLFLIDGLTSSAQTKRRLRACAQALMDQTRPGDFNQALMGMGALVCAPRNPDCDQCPARAHCAARRAQAQRDLPNLPAPVAKRVEKRAVALVYAGNRVLVRQRSQEGLLAGLWEFPNFLNARRDEEVREALLEMGVAVRGHRAGERIEHVFTHLVWKLTGHEYEMVGQADCPREDAADARWVDKAALEALPMATPMQKYRALALNHMEDA